MTFRLRLAIAAALAVALTIAASSAVVYVVMRNQLRTSVDQQLRQQWAQLQQTKGLEHAFDQRDFGGPIDVPKRGPSASGSYLQAVRSDGATALTRYESDKVPVTKETLRVATGKRNAFFADGEVGGKRSRIYTVYLGATPDGTGFALQFVRPTDDIEHTLGRLRLILLLIVAGGIAVGGGAGALVARAALVPVRRLTGTAERIAETRDPSERVPVTGHDELSRLGTAFNTMLGALEDSIETQRRFVADASHELRTPLTSMQTNIEVLRQHERLDPEGRRKLFDDLEREAHEMRDLIAGLLELARGDANLERRPVQLDELVESAVERARSRFPNVTFDARIEPTVVEGVPERLDRAVWNLLENAGKWSNGDGPVEVSLAGGELRVRDHGPGIAAEDRERIFDRFYRATAARSLPGSGVGLAIVREVVEGHGGGGVGEAGPGGGAMLGGEFDNC